MTATFFAETYVDRIPKGWQNFVDNSALCNIFQTADWAKALLNAGLNALLVVAKDGAGEIKGGMLGTHDRYSFLKFSISPTILVCGGPLTYNINDKLLIEKLVRAFDVEAKKLGVVHSFIRSFVSLDDTLIGQLNYITEDDRVPCTVIINLTQSTEDLWKQLQKRGRTGIQKAIKKGVTVEEGKASSDLLAYYQIVGKTAERLEIVPPSFRVIESLWRAFSKRDNIKLFLAKHRDKAIAGALVCRWRDKMWWWHGASLSEYWNLNANLLIQWSIINWGTKNHVKVYDLMGIPCKKDSNHPKYGLYLFKTQFGGKIVKHGEYVKHYSPLKAVLLSKVLVPIHRRLFRAQSF